ncbi:co-chaperone GrpE [Planomonospora sphaerica]|uniref:Co-chaperone GrpE n=1 Tax=Planomonospora sphaerica TaxID=161355 RepID=A0A171DI06_9ACTN|nr:nucleotide exchange factor GrpE [Planomonospora sphaerica]GAT68598.1 co-chaperone GrpE [Planomonospora sphaerica]
MKDARALPALLLAAFLALTGCAPVTAGSAGESPGLGRVAAGSDGAVIASPLPASGGGQDGDAPLKPPAREGEPGREGGGGDGPAEVGETGPVSGLGLPFPLPLLLVPAAGALLAVAAALYLRQRGRTAPAAWQGGPGPAEFPVAAGPPPTAPPSPAPGGSPSPAAPTGAPTMPTGAPTGAPTMTSPMPPATPPAAPPGSPPAASPAPPAVPAGASPVPPAPPGGPEGPPPQPGFAASGPGPLPGPAESDPLADALTEVARSGISPALAQRVERLFADGHPGRQALLDACIDCRDQIDERHPRLSGMLLDGLNRAGVREILADGQRFDPRLHEAFGTEPTDRPELHDVVAETVKQGYAEGEHVIRVPQVAVYRHERPGDGTPR